MMMSEKEFATIGAKKMLKEYKDMVAEIEAFLKGRKHQLMNDVKVSKFKGKQKKGKRAKLTDTDRETMIEMYKNQHKKVKEIAKKFGVHETTVYSIVKGK